MALLKMRSESGGVEYHLASDNMFSSATNNNNNNGEDNGADEDVSASDDAHNLSSTISLASTLTRDHSITSINNINGAEENIESETARLRLVFPLGGENLDHLRFPTHVLHYSVSPSARYVYVVGQLISGITELNVWDLHLGKRTIYNYDEMRYIRHFYALNDSVGFAVCSNADFEKFLLYSVTIDHRINSVRERTHIFDYSTNGHVLFWSSCRHLDYGVVFAVIDQRGAFIYKYDLDALKDGAEKRIMIGADRMSANYFVGQPFVHDNCVMFLEREVFSLRLTGRVVRIRLDDESGQMDCVQTKADRSCDIFTSQGMGGKPNRIKHVERNGRLWSIMESTELNAGPIFGTHLPVPKRRHLLGVLCLRTWRWRAVELTGIDWDYDEISLDVTASGTVVMIKRGSCVMDTPVVYGFYFFQTDTPMSLQNTSFYALMRNFEHLRHEDVDRLRVIGVPRCLV